jgi:hypothetical protein
MEELCEENLLEQTLKGNFRMIMIYMKFGMMMIYMEILNFKPLTNP